MTDAPCCEDFMTPTEKRNWRRALTAFDRQDQRDRQERIWLRQQGWSYADIEQRVPRTTRPHDCDFLKRHRKAFEHAYHEWQQTRQRRWQKTIVFRLRASLHPFSDRNPHRRPLQSLKKQLQHPHSRAWDIITESLTVLEGLHIQKQEWVKGYVVRLHITLAEENPVETLQDHYGEGAIDGWMEGDLSFNDDWELHLTLVGKPQVIQSGGKSPNNDVP